MPEYYLDIETYSPQLRPDPLTDKIITIQYQRLSTEDGKPEGELTILKEWEHGSEKDMLDAFRKVFITGKDFDFMPIGVNLYGFDLIAIIHKLNYYFNMNLDMTFFRSRPIIDIKPILVILNHGRLKGYQDWLGKDSSGSVIKDLYMAGAGGDKASYEKIVEYVRKEASNFVEKYQILKSAIPKIKAG
jgi:hypothetical protein